MCVRRRKKNLYVHQKKAFVSPFLEEMETDANLTLVYSSAFSLLILNFKSVGERACPIKSLNNLGEINQLIKHEKSGLGRFFP